MQWPGSGWPSRHRERKCHLLTNVILMCKYRIHSLFLSLHFLRYNQLGKIIFFHRRSRGTFHPVVAFPSITAFLMCSLQSKPCSLGRWQQDVNKWFWPRASAQRLSGDTAAVGLLSILAVENSPAFLRAWWGNSDCPTGVESTAGRHNGNKSYVWMGKSWASSPGQIWQGSVGRPGGIENALVTFCM